VTTATTAIGPGDGNASRSLAGLRLLEFCDYYGPSSMGGSERVARAVNRELAAMGASICVVSAANGPAFDDEGVDVERRPAVDLTRVAGVQLSLARGYTRAAARVVERVRPHVLYAHTVHFHGSLVAARLARRHGIPLVTVVHVASTEALRGRAGALAALHDRTIARSILARSSAVVAVSPVVAAHAVRLGAPRSRVFTALNGVDHERFRPSPEPAGRTRVLYVGRLVENKGVRVLLDAARLAWRRGADFDLVFAGDGPLRKRLERAAAAESARVTFVGHVDDVPAHLAAAHVVVRPSYTEGMPLAVLEALAARRCVLVSDIPAHTAFVDDAVSGIVHRVGDVEHLAERLVHVVTDAAVRARVAEAGADRVALLTWRACAEGHADALRRAARSSGRARAGSTA
jgi:glycosyltransferase involved in cell wall biosynthesis